MRVIVLRAAKRRHRYRERALFSRQHLACNKPDNDENDMEQKTARLTVLIDPTKKDAFEQLCASQDVTPSQVVRQLIREYLEKHGATYANQPQNTSGTSE